MSVHTSIHLSVCIFMTELLQLSRETKYWRSIITLCSLWKYMNLFWPITAYTFLWTFIKRTIVQCKSQNRKQLNRFWDWINAGLNKCAWGLQEIEQVVNFNCNYLIFFRQYSQTQIQRIRSSLMKMMMMLILIKIAVCKILHKEKNAKRYKLQVRGLQ